MNNVNETKTNDTTGLKSERKQNPAWSSSLHSKVCKSEDILLWGPRGRPRHVSQSRALELACALLRSFCCNWGLAFASLTALVAALPTADDSNCCCRADAWQATSRGHASPDSWNMRRRCVWPGMRLIAICVALLPDSAHRFSCTCTGVGICGRVPALCVSPPCLHRPVTATP